MPPPAHPVHSPHGPHSSPEPARRKLAGPLLLAATAGLLAFPLLRRRRKRRGKVQVTPLPEQGSGVPGAARAYEGIVSKMEGLWQLSGKEGRYRAKAVRC